MNKYIVSYEIDGMLYRTEMDATSETQAHSIMENLGYIVCWVCAKEL